MGVFHVDVDTVSQHQALTLRESQSNRFLNAAILKIQAEVFLHVKAFDR